MSSYRNSLLGPKQASNVFNTNALNNNDYVNVIAYFTNGCGRTSTNLFFNVDAIPAGVLSSDASNNTACTGDMSVFAAVRRGINSLV